MPPADPNGPRLGHNSYIIRIRQHPARGKVLGKDKDRKPIDPPPVVQLFVRDPNDPAQNYLQSPYYWMAATLWHETEDRPPNGGHNQLCGSLSSSLHRLKDMDSQGQSRDGGFFVFGDLSAKIEGKFRLKVILYETLQGEVQGLADGVTNVFEVYNAKNFPGMAESTFMSRSFGDQGVRLRIRKESRQLLKRPASSYSPQSGSQNLPSQGLPNTYAQPVAGYGNQVTTPTYGGSYVKNEEVEESASKRQRSANTSPTGYYDRAGAQHYVSMAPTAYTPQAYANAYGQDALGNTGSMAMPDSGLLQQAGAYPSRASMGYDASQQPSYGYDPSRASQVLPMYGGRPQDPTAAAAAAAAQQGYSANGYPAYQTGQYPASTTAGISGYPYSAGIGGSRSSWTGQQQGQQQPPS